MKTFLLAISALFLALPPAASSGTGLQVSPIEAGSLEIEPRKIVTSLFLITNESSWDLEVSARTDLPHKWLIIAGDSTIHVGAHQRDISLVSVLVPRTAQPGQYSLTYFVGAADHPDLVDTCSVPVVVLPVTRLEVKRLNAPDFVVAGDDFRASFAVSNRGNAVAAVHLRTETAHRLPFVLNDQTLEISPGQTIEVDLHLKTDSQLRKTMRDNLTLVCEAADLKAEAHATAPVEVIPKITGVEDLYDRVPSVIALRNVTDGNGEVRSRFQGEISGAGTFGEAGGNRLTFLAKGPGVQRIGVLGRRDEYFLTYSTGSYAIAVGDRAYSVSQLTENNHYGRGLEAKINLKRFGFGAYGLRGVSYEPHEGQAAAYVDYALSEAASVGLNYLFKDLGRASHILGFESRIGLPRHTDLEAEYSAGLTEDRDRNAYYLRLRSTQKRAAGFLRFIHADPAYPGYVKDTDFIWGGAGVVIRPTSKIYAGFRQERHNLVEGDRPCIPTEREYDLRFDERMVATDVSLGWRTRSHEDRQDLAGSDYVENILRSSVGQRFKMWNYYAALESGWIHDQREDHSSSLQRCSASLDLRPADRQSYRCYLSYDTSRIPGKTRRRYLAVGLSSLFSIESNTTLYIGFRSSNYEDGRSIESNMVDLTLSHKFPRKSTVLLRAYYRPWESASAHDEVGVLLEYAVPVGVPVAKRRSIGTVKGHVYDDLTGLPVEDVVLRLDGATAVTNSKGNFVFPSVAAGDYHLRLDRATIGLDRITIQKAPIEVTIEGGKEDFVQIGVTRSAGLRGRVMLYRSRAGGSMPSAADTDDLVENRGLADLLVELTDGVETKRAFTDEEGRFTFDEMRPSAWTLTVSEDNLPEYARLETSTLEFHPKPGDQIQTLIRVLPQRRRVQILHEGGVLKE